MKEDREALTFLNILILIMSVYVLFALIIDTLFKLPTETSRLLNIIDTAICGFFLLDFSIRFYKADNKLKFMKWGWIDLLASIPNIDFLRAGRALRLFKLIRILRAFRSTKHIFNFVFANKSKGLLSSVIIISILLIIFSSISILQVEDAENSNIKTAEDAIWWSYTTITTVGYGDKYPVTSEGRLIAMFLMTAGVGLFGTFSGFIASWFLEDKKTTPPSKV